MKQLWAPWRMTFLEDTHEKKQEGCIFCTLVQEKADEKNLIVHRAERVFVILNKYPYNNGHVMVIPFQHTNRLEDLSKETLGDLMLWSRHCQAALDEAYQPQGFNLGMNLGTAGGAGIKDHLHMHIVPRWVGDTNFLPVLADTKSMPQHLSESFESIQKYFGRLKSP